jgi:hypothetical protein
LTVVRVGSMPVPLGASHFCKSTCALRGRWRERFEHLY